ncbi:T9SS type A sorting domain-containing protein [Chryseobacterium sp. KACC 21268]|nr:T9SS type A sorting domain-containing protein [Chryseobacterium sp. KACC 21268]
MKRIFTLSFIALIGAQSLTAQTTDVATGINYPWGIAFKGNDLYITEALTGSISKINVNDASPTPTLVMSGLSTAIELAFKGDELYINEFDAKKISKINITDATPTPVDVLTGITGEAYSLQIKGNDLYYAQYFENKISKIDLSNPTPTPTNVVTGVGTPSGLFFDGDVLYISESVGKKISKINITDPVPTASTVVTGLEDEPYTSILYGSDLYVLLASVGKIVKVDLSATNPTATDVVTGIALSRGMAIKDNYLYISDFIGNKISKLQLPTLAVNDFSKVNFQAYPNPVSDFLQISGLTKAENYTIFNISGMQLSKGVINNNQKINTENLKSGLYLIKLENGQTIKFIKK